MDKQTGPDSVSTLAESFGRQTIDLDRMRMKPQLFYIAVFPALPACCHYPGDSLRSFQDLQVETGRWDVQAHLGREASKVSATHGRGRISLPLLCNFVCFRAPSDLKDCSPPRQSTGWRWRRAVRRRPADDLGVDDPSTAVRRLMKSS